MVELETQNLTVAFTQIDPVGTPGAPSKGHLVAHHYQGHNKPVLSDVSLALEAGKMVAVIGSSGGGKSVLAHALVGILPAHCRITGRVLHRGRELCERDARSFMTLIPQASSFLDPNMRVGHAVHLAARRAGLSRVKAVRIQREAFRALQLPELASSRYPRELSGGMIKRVFMAMALVTSSSVVIADEPTHGLHAEAASLVFQQLRALADRGAAVLVITHDIATAVRMADRVAVMHEGVLLEQASPDAFEGDGSGLQHRFSRRLWNALPQNQFTSELA